jgi:site-specific recombinase XerD
VCPLHLIPKLNHLILESYDDFILSRQAALLSPSTIEFYNYTAGEFVDFLISHNIFEPERIKSNTVRAYLSKVNSRGVSNSTVHAHARGTRAFLRFLKEEWYNHSTYQYINASCRAKENEGSFPSGIEPGSQGL